MGNRFVIDWDQYAGLARRVAAEGAVLVRNEGQVLPLWPGTKISVFGRIQFHYYKSGTGSGGMVNTRYVVGILDALKEEDGLVLNEQLEQVYLEWIKTHPFDQGAGWAQEPWSQEEMPLSDEVIAQAVDCSDAAVIVIGRTAGEDRDAANAEGSYLLSAGEEAMLKQVCGAFDKVIVVLNVGNIIDMRWVEKYQPQAVLYTWQGGMEGGHAVADVLTGRVNPCGKLPDTIATAIEDYPSTAEFGGEDGNFYTEDIYVGYRYFETFAKEKVLYPFGYGLSYTKFAVACSGMQRADDMLTIDVQVKNTGDCAGREVVQAYIKPPQGKLGKPVRNLAAFAKTKLLEPGEAQTLTLTMPDAVMASYDDTGVTGHKSCYVLEEGTYEVYVGTDVRSAVLAGGFDEDSIRVVEQCTEALTPVEAFDRIHPQPESDGSFEVGMEPVPLRTYSLADRMNGNQGEELAYTGNQGYVLGDVYDKKTDLDTFIAQLSDEELCCIVRGEGMCSPKVTPGTAAAFGGVTDELKAYGIPCGCCADGPSGIRMDCGTYAFSMPNGTCLASTFDEELVEKLYQMEGAELRKNRIDTLLGPGINIHRNPLNGRNFEYFSEDPLVTGRLAAAQLKGMHAYGVTGTIKHFVANNQEYHRRKYNARVSERALREIYLKGFEIAVREGGAYSIMTTYGAVNGLWTAGSYDLLTTILRGEWHYDGMVMTDWWADINEEGKEATTANTAAMVRAQNDVYMVTQDAKGNTNEDNLAEALESGMLKRSALQRSCANILKMLMRSPVMERSLGRMSQEEIEAAELMDEDDRVNFDVEFYPVGEELVVDMKGVDTSKGTTLMYGLNTSQPGFYNFSIKAKVDAVELAQVPMTVSLNGHISGTITLNGTNGQWVEAKQNLGAIVSPYNYLKLYFAQSGMQIDTMTITLREKMERTF